MARRLGIECEGAVYHVTTIGDERGSIFFSKTEYRRFKEYITYALEKYRFTLHFYMLITNHLLIETSEGGEIFEFLTF